MGKYYGWIPLTIHIKFSIISLFFCVSDYSSNLIRFLSLSSLFSSTIGSHLVGKSECSQVKLAKYPTLYTLASSGACTKEQKGEDCSDTIDQGCPRKKMKVKKGNGTHTKKYIKEHTNIVKTQLPWINKNNKILYNIN